MSERAFNPARTAACALRSFLVLACCCAISTAQGESSLTPGENPQTPQEERAVPPKPSLRQKPQPAPQAELDSKTKNLLQGRDRAQMHDGDPLELIGVEQGSNDLRSRTPALANSDHRERQIDVNEMHERALAMYDKDAHFSQPPAPVSADNAKTKKAASTKSAKGPDGAPQHPYRSRIVVVGALLASLIGIGLMLQRHLRLLRANEASIV